jgi:hypothetical protein
MLNEEGIRERFAGLLTEEEKKLFMETFYKELPFDVYDKEGKYPWGAPWKSDWRKIMEGDSIEEMARKHARERISFIRSCLPEIAEA